MRFRYGPYAGRLLEDAVVDLIQRKLDPERTIGCQWMCLQRMAGSFQMTIVDYGVCVNYNGECRQTCKPRCADLQNAPLEPSSAEGRPTSI